MFTTASIGVTGILLAVILLMEVTAIVCLVVASRRSTLDASEPRLVLVFSPTGDEQHVPMIGGQAQ